MEAAATACETMAVAFLSAGPFDLQQEGYVEKLLYAIYRAWDDVTFWTMSNFCQGGAVLACTSQIKSLKSTSLGEICLDDLSPILRTTLKSPTTSKGPRFDMSSLSLP